MKRVAKKRACAEPDCTTSPREGRYCAKHETLWGVGWRKAVTDYRAGRFRVAEREAVHGIIFMQGYRAAVERITVEENL
jgi:hypothetical protein